jgi:hypothetical protein
MITRYTRSTAQRKSIRLISGGGGNDNDVDDDTKDVGTKSSKTAENERQYKVEEEEEEAASNQAIYVLDGVEYDTYVDFVAAKRQRNEDRLRALGFMDKSTNFMISQSKRSSTSAVTSQRGIKRTKQKQHTEPTLIRKSSRLSGSKSRLISLDYNVNDWNRDNTTVVRQGRDPTGENEEEEVEPPAETFFKGRVNDGSDLTLEQAIDLNDSKWNGDHSVAQAQALMQNLKTLNIITACNSQTFSSKIKSDSPKTVTAAIDGAIDLSVDIASKIRDLSIDKEEWVAKVTPDRIYYVTTHPCESRLVCCAGDKQGYVGLWDTDAVITNDNPNQNHGVSLFRPHSRPICCLDWLNHGNMISASYDGSIRSLDVERGVFEEIFATYDDSDSTFLEDLGYGLDQGYRYWIQFVTVDRRSVGMSNPSLFVSTSVGDIFHLDLRSPRNGRITFHESVSDKKINTVRYVMSYLLPGYYGSVFPLAYITSLYALSSKSSSQWYYAGKRWQ